MMRPRGWIQDSGNLENLIKVVEIFNRRTRTFRDFVNNQIPNKVRDIRKRTELLNAIQNTNGYNRNPLINFHSLTGSRTSNNVVDGIVQALLPGQNRVGIVDWACDNFIRFAYTLDFISYQQPTDSFTITDFGLQLTSARTEADKFEIIKTALKQYPPTIRVLELLQNQYNDFPQTPSLTKFEIGRELGFKGEDGFTTYSQNVFIQALNSTEIASERNKIKSNWEGSSDKYARMICGWLMHDRIGWLQLSKKDVSVQIGREIFTENLQSYQITVSGIAALRSCRPYSRNTGTPKNVSFEMLATKGADKEYLRIRRTLIINCLSRSKTLLQIQTYLSQNNLTDIPTETILDDIKNISRIGLQVASVGNTYKIVDTIQLLQIPNYIQQNLLSPSSLIQTKQQLSQDLQHLDHTYFDLLDFSIAGQRSARQFEVRIVELLNQIIVAKHLSGGNRPEIIGYNPQANPDDCVIMDSKAYGEGFGIPAAERDKMIRYIEEYNKKDENLNRNRWWENFQSPDYPTIPIKYSFVSSSFINQFANQLTYIRNRTGADGSAITAETLLRKVDSVLGNINGYNIDEFFNDIGCNSLVS